MKHKFASLFFACLAGLISPCSCPAQEKPAASETATDAETAALVKKVMEVSQVKSTMEKSIGTMIEQGKKAAGPNADKLPPEFWPEVEKELRKQLPALLDTIVPLYAKHFTKSDLNALIDFYTSPAGRKLAEKQPLILQESMMAGSAWGEKIGRQVMERILKKKATD